jgi:hypothetical protein
MARELQRPARMKKRLRLARITLQHLTTHDLQRVAGGIQTGMVTATCQASVCYECTTTCI